MEYARLETSDLKVSKIGLGAWQFGTEGWGFGQDFTEQEALGWSLSPEELARLDAASAGLELSYF